MNSVIKLFFICLFIVWQSVWVRAQIVQGYDLMNEVSENGQVEVYGSANLGDGRRDRVLLKQQGDANPLGNPIIFAKKQQNSDSASGENVQSVAHNVSKPTLSFPTNVVQESLPINPKISPQEMPQEVDKQIQNTLYYGGGRIYDVQSYPTSDIDYIETPNLGRTITTFPAY